MSSLLQYSFNLVPGVISEEWMAFNNSVFDCPLCCVEVWLAQLCDYLLINVRCFWQDNFVVEIITTSSLCQQNTLHCKPCIRTSCLYAERVLSCMRVYARTMECINVTQLLARFFMLCESWRERWIRWNGIPVFRIGVISLLVNEVRGTTTLEWCEFLGLAIVPQRCHSPATCVLDLYQCLLAWFFTSPPSPLPLSLSFSLIQLLWFWVPSLARLQKAFYVCYGLFPFNLCFLFVR